MKSLNMCLNHNVRIYMNISVKELITFNFFDMKSAKERRQKQLCLCGIDKPESNKSINQSLSCNKQLLIVFPSPSHLLLRTLRTIQTNPKEI